MTDNVITPQQYTDLAVNQAATAAKVTEHERRLTCIDGEGGAIDRLHATINKINVTIAWALGGGTVLWAVIQFGIAYWMNVHK